MSFRSRYPHFIASLLLVIAVLGITSGSPVFVKPAHAQLSTVIAENIPERTNNILDEILHQLAQAAVTAFFNAARQFAGKIAYDAANYIASGGKGQAALVYEQGFGSYMGSVAQDTAGEFIGSLSNDSFFRTIGFDLCRPPNPNQLLNLQFSIGNQSQLLNSIGLNGSATNPPRPRCQFQDIVNNYNQLASTLSNTDVLRNINTSISTNSSQLGFSAIILGRSADSVAKQLGAKQLERYEGLGYKAVEQGLSGKIGTPASLVKRQTEQQLVETPATDQSNDFLATMGTAFEQGFGQLASYTASLFINTLTNKMLDRIMQRGIVGAFDFSDLEQRRTAANPDAVVTRNQTDTRRANVDIKDVALLRVSEVEIVSELIACPTNRGLWNCSADQNLAAAIEPKGTQGGITINSAIEQGFLKQDWELIPASDARRNQDRLCYTYGYCAGNLAKLRVMRILPVGFEFAANSQVNIERCTTGRCVTLGEVVDNFSNCNDAGLRDDSHPWCKLIDPNWVITSFQQQCQLTGYGDTLASNSLSQRREECRDIQTCLQRNDKGECVGGYGYCVAEKLAYRFNADECPAQYSSCQTYSTRQGQGVSYLRSTVDHGTCSTSNVGCLGYSPTRDAAGNWTSARVYFDKTIETCGQNNDGCTKLLAAEVGGSSLNYLLNPSFELVSGTPGSSDSWGAPASSIASSGFDGGSSLQLSASTVSQSVSMAGGRLLTLSFYTQKQGAGVSNASVTVRQFTSTDATGAAISTAVTGPLFRSGGCDAVASLPQITVGTPTSQWQRYECTFLSATSTRSAMIDFTGANALVDAVELEEGQFATPYISGDNASLPVVHMKLPPDDLGCNENSTSTACAAYARICRQVDAGCQGYTDTAGGPEVPAILSTNDLCPNECVGYAEYHKQPSSFDLVIDPDPSFSDPADATSSYFIPSTGKICKQQDVGCEAFTNVEAASAGGESSLAFSYLQSCRKPDPARTKTFFAWEGSETAGYQLRTFSLISAAAPRADLGETVIGPEIVTKRGPDGQYKNPASCNAALWRTGVDPDCRQYYDRDGNVFYRYETQTIISSDACVQLRIARNSNQADCVKTDGDFNPATGACVYNALITQSRVCQPQVAGCKAYSGSSAGNVQVLVNENFRTDRGRMSAGDLSTESLLVGDQSLRLSSSAVQTEATYASTQQGLYRVSFWAKAPGVAGLNLALSVRNPSVAGSSVSVGTVALGADWQRFTVGLWNGPSGATSTLNFQVVGAIGSRNVYLDEVRVEEVRDVVYVVENSWNTPAICDRSFAGTPEPQAMLGCRAYKDRLGNTVSAYRFTRLCRDEAIGCRAFVDTRNSDAVGSQTFALNDASPVPVYNVSSTPSVFFPGTTTTRAADRMVYAVYDKTKLCQAENDSCRAFGLPVLSDDRSTVSSYTTVYLKDDISKYGDGLCRPSEEFCEEFDNGSGKEYFRDPGKKACEYRETQRLTIDDFADAPDVLAALGGDTFTEGDYSGWFRKGTNVPCYPEILQNGNTFGLPLRGDDLYTGWYGTCPNTMNSCTEFRDPNDTTDPLYPTGRPYYFLNNDRIDKSSCQGNVDEGNGCILLRDMGNPVLNYNIAASYGKYRDAGYRPTAPVNCSANPTDRNCTAVSSTENDVNLLLKVNVERDCAQWLGCKSSETVFDTATRSYKDVCTNLALCDKSSGKPADIFCANYVDRSSTTTAGILTNSAFFNVDLYTQRDVGLGQRDYSGYAIPDTFQAVDTKSIRVAALGASGVVPDAPFRFSQDYRLAAVVPMVVRTITDTSVPSLPQYCVTAPGHTPVDGEAIPLNTASSSLAAANTGLHLCQDVQTGLIGFFEASKCSGSNTKTINCYLPVRSTSDSSNFQNLAAKFSLEDPRTDVTLTEAYPPAECRSNPEADSPFSGKYVTAWDFTQNPPKPTKAAGFTSANTCEYGEDCVCSYKRADYGGIKSKFLGLDSQNVPTGICIGGPRDGQACLPSSVLDVTISGGTGSDALAQGIQTANAALGCGPALGGGRCVAFDKLQVVRGVFGQCLERDTTRFLGLDQTDRECLTYNPNPILFGDKDPYHWQPTSGYLPPQNAGQYYCVSPAKNPLVVTLNFQHFKRYVGSRPVLNPQTDSEAVVNWGDSPAHPETTQTAHRAHDADFDWRGAYDRQFDNASEDGTYVGRMTKLHYDKDWLGQDNRCAPNECEFFSSSIDGTSNFHTAQELACEAADDIYDSGKSADGGHGGIHSDYLRLVDASDGYRETFYRINTSEMVRALGGYVNSGNGSVNVDDVDNLLSDNNIGYFQFTPAPNSNVGYLGCGYSAEWVDNVPSIDYSNAGSLQSAYSTWKEGFNRDFNPFVARSSEEVLQSADHPLPGPCVADDVRVNGEPDGLSDQCYFKVWQTGYRDKDQREFDGIYTDDSHSAIGPSLLSLRQNPTRAACDGSRPYFAIRAVFQTSISNTTAGGSSSISPTQVVGPWRFVGFWVSACSGRVEDDQRYMYFQIKLGAASVCRELAEVKSSSSNQDAAFTDRVSQASGYRDPATGVTYSLRNSPFASALNTGVAGADPLFQDGGELAGFDPLHPPTFLASGVRSYFQNSTIPRDKWAYLSNLFGRIYRVYRFHNDAVTKTDMACLAGPLKGVKCSVAGGSSPECQTSGTCKPEALSAQDCSSIHTCNTQSGVSKGQLCGDNENTCRGPTIHDVSGSNTVTVFNNCVANPDVASPSHFWVKNADGTYSNSHLSPPRANVSAARAREVDSNAFRCDTSFGPNIAKIGTTTGDDTLAGDYCSAIKNNSSDCPVAVAGTCDGTSHLCTFFPGDATNHAKLASYPGINLTSVSCVASADCSYTDDNWNGVDDTERGACSANVDITACRSVGNGRCVGGLKDGMFCHVVAAGLLDVYSCTSDLAASTCGPVSSGADPATECRYPAGSSLVNSTANDLATDNNACTHPAGYYPRMDLCPNPQDEYCGLFTYDLVNTAASGPLDPSATQYRLPTDVTIGHYTPSFLGFSSGGFTPATFNYISYYTPRPPQIAAPDTRNCPTPGQCTIAQIGTFSLNGQANGVINGGIGQSKASLLFYGWASHNQMPLRQVTVDWGDGNKTEINDTRLKNRKPFCGAQSECSNVPGLTCNTDADCPPGGGRCVATGTCEKSPFRNCSSDAECTIGGVADRCNVRTMFGNAQDACERDYFSFDHVYTCPSDTSALPACDTDAVFGGITRTGRCSKDPNKWCIPGAPTELANSSTILPGNGCSPGDTCMPAGDLAPTTGCFDTTTNSCRFTPRVMLQDNWGWCTGECRGNLIGGSLADVNNSPRHPYGGCYSDQPLGANGNTRTNSNVAGVASTLNTVAGGECNQNYPVFNFSNQDHIRPWIVYPGSVQIRPNE